MLGKNGICDTHYSCVGKDRDDRRNKTNGLLDVACVIFDKESNFLLLLNGWSNRGRRIESVFLTDTTLKNLLFFLLNLFYLWWCFLFNFWLSLWLCGNWRALFHLFLISNSTHLLVGSLLLRLDRCLSSSSLFGNLSFLFLLCDESGEL